MRQLLGENQLEDKILKQLFLQRMPNNVQLILASSGDTIGAEGLAAIADKIVEVSRPPIVASNTSSTPHCIPDGTPVPQTPSLPPSVSAVEHRMESLESNITRLVGSMEKLVSRGEEDRRYRSRGRGNGRGRGRGRGQHNYRRRSKSRSRDGSAQSTDTGQLCYHHSKFGKNAYYCSKPCTYFEAGASSEKEN